MREKSVIKWEVFHTDVSMHVSCMHTARTQQQNRMLFHSDRIGGCCWCFFFLLLSVTCLSYMICLAVLLMVCVFFFGFQLIFNFFYGFNVSVCMWNLYIPLGSIRCSVMPTLHTYFYRICLRFFLLPFVHPVALHLHSYLIWISTLVHTKIASAKWMNQMSILLFSPRSSQAHTHTQTQKTVLFRSFS